MKVLTVTAGAVVFVATMAVGQSAPQARADGESVQGAWSGEVAVFKGVPFAVPPVGALRWKPPVPRPAGAGARQATQFGPSCMQTDRLGVWSKGIAVVFGTADKIFDEPLNPSEDCLYLNVWTRTPGSGAKPVMVWIHGGSNLNGSGSSNWYDGAALARRGVVVVSVNYRLGVFGFLAHPALAAESPNGSAGNYGLMDQLEALRWVKRNIRSFGGDPSRVTVFGESAGSIDVMHLMASPQATGLFHRAIAQSGAPMAPMLDLKTSGGFGVALAKLVGADTAQDQLAALRAKPAADLLAAQDRMFAGGMLVGPNVDGSVLSDMTVRIFERGEQLKVPLLAGTNALEMTTLRIYLPRFERTAEGYRKWVTQAAGAGAAKVLELYPASTPAEIESASLELSTHMLFTCPTRIAARAMTKAGQKTYLYQFTRVAPGGDKLGAFHAAEISYVFGNRLAWFPRDQTDEALSAAMGDYWIRFATTGNPNGGTGPTWPAHGGGREEYLELGNQVTPRADLKRDVCDALEPAMRSGWAKPTS